MQEIKLPMSHTMCLPELRFLASLLLPLTLWAGEPISTNPFVESPTPPREIMRVPVNESKDRVVVTACLITLEEDAVGTLLEQLPELRKGAVTSSLFLLPDSVKNPSTEHSPLSLSHVLQMDGQLFLRKLGSIEGVEIVHTPRLHGHVGKTVMFREGSELIFPIAWEAGPENPENLVPVDFETRHLGLEFSFTAEHQKDDVYTLDYSLSHTKLTGFLHVQTGKAYQGDWRDRNALRNHQPVFKSQSQNSNVVLSLGETMILGGMIVENATKGEGADAKTVITRTMVLTTLSLEKYDGP